MITDSDSCPDSLRERARQRVAGNGTDLSRLSEQDVRALAEELQIHQVELELQQEELREAERALVAARDRYQELFERAPVGYLILDVEGMIQDLNPAAAGLLGQARSELSGRPLGRFIDDDSQEEWFRHRYALRREGGRQVHTLRLRSGEQGPRTVHVETVAAEEGADGATAPRFRSALVDITARRQAEQALEAERDQLEDRVALRTRELEAACAAREQLLDSLGNGLFALDDEGRFSSLNPAALELLGYSAQSELIGFKAHPVIHDPSGSDEGRRCPVCQPPAETPLEGHRDRFVTADGSVVAVDLHARPVRRADSPERVVVAFTQVTEQTAALDRLSPRERDVTTHLVEGLTNREIGEVLGISRRTVEEYRAQVMRKLKVGSFAELVRLAGGVVDTR